MPMCEQLVTKLVCQWRTDFYVKGWDNQKDVMFTLYFPFMSHGMNAYTMFMKKKMLKEPFCTVTSMCHSNYSLYRLYSQIYIVSNILHIQTIIIVKLSYSVF